MYLEGKHVNRPANETEVKQLINKKIEYMLKSDVDNSGRGWHKFRTGIIVEVMGKNMKTESGEYIYLPDILEIVLCDEVNL